MKIETIRNSLLTGAAILTFSGYVASAAIHNFTVTLDSMQEVPTNASPATGSGTVVYDDVADTVNWNIAWTNLSGPATGIHFHGPAAPGANAGVQINIGAISGTTSPTMGMSAITPLQGADLLNDLWYVNIHSGMFAGGEIRGQVVLNAVPEPATSSIFLLGAAVCMGVRRIRRRPS